MHFFLFNYSQKKSVKDELSGKALIFDVVRELRHRIETPFFSGKNGVSIDGVESSGNALALRRSDFRPVHKA